MFQLATLKQGKARGEGRRVLASPRDRRGAEAGARTPSLPRLACLVSLLAAGRRYGYSVSCIADLRRVLPHFTDPFQLGGEKKAVSLALFEAMASGTGAIWAFVLGALTGQTLNAAPLLPTLGALLMDWATV